MIVKRNITQLDSLKIFINKIIGKKISKTINRLLYMNYYVIWGEGEEALISIDNTAWVAGNTLMNVNWWKIIIWKYAMISQNCSLITWTHDYLKFKQDRMTNTPINFIWDIIIEDWARICNNSTIIGPCVMWENAVVAAWSVVTKDVPPYTIVWWNPAKIIKKIPH